MVVCRRPGANEMEVVCACGVEGEEGSLTDQASD
jgi:hypothetical protein